MKLILPFSTMIGEQASRRSIVTALLLIPASVGFNPLWYLSETVIMMALMCFVTLDSRKDHNPHKSSKSSPVSREVI